MNGIPIAVVAVVLLAVPLVPLPTSPTVIAPPLSSARGPSSYLPAAFTAPFAARAGFDPAYLAEVPGAAAATGTLEVVLGLWPSDPSIFLSPTPSAPSASPLALAERFGRSPTEYASLESYFASRGLTVVHAWPDRLSLSLEGPARSVGAAFGTTILTGVFDGRTVHFPASDPVLPSRLEAEIASVVGLSDGFSSFGFSLSPVPFAPSPAQGRTSTFITPSATHLLYGLSTLYNVSGTPRYATGTGIAVVLWGDGYNPSDLQTFFSTYYAAGFPAVSISYDNVDGAPAPSASAVSDPSNAPQELTLDLEWAGSAAPGASLHAVYAPDGPASNSYSPSDATLEDALQTAVNLPGIDIVSMSFGTPDGGDLALQSGFALSFAKANQLGISVLAASGDSGGAARGGCQGGAAADFPATYPTVLSVGGTAPVESLDALGAVTGLDSEPAWNGSGGGYSGSYPAPTWQTASVPAIAQSGERGTPDVAGPAYNNFFYYNSGERAGRGTSFATPMWAGIIADVDALLGRPIGPLPPRLYAIGPAIAQGTAAPGMIDITSGANCVAAAGTGWDAVSGWGSPRALPLYADLSSSFVTVGLTSSAASVVPGGSFAATVNVLNETTHRPIAGLPVSFVLSAPGYTGPCGGTLASAQGTTNASGNTTASLTVPGCFLGTSTLLTVTVASSGYFGQNSTTVAVNLVGLAGFLAIVQVFPYNLVAFAVIVLIAIWIGYWIGERRRPRSPRTAVPRPVAATPPGPGGSALGPPTPPPSSPTAAPRPVEPPPPLPASPPRPESTDAPLGASAAPMPEVPPHVLEPPAPPPPISLPSVEVRRCPYCHAAVGSTARICPDCGTTLTTPVADPSSGS